MVYDFHQHLNNLSVIFISFIFCFRAKSKNGGRMLREKLEKIGMTLPAGNAFTGPIDRGW